MKHTPGEWKWKGEDYRGDWGWQILVGPNGEGIIVGDDVGEPSQHIKANMPVDPELCITGMKSTGKPHVNAVHVYSEANAKLISLAPTAPHECGDPDCPGNINRKKLEAYPDLLEACKLAKKLTDAVVEQFSGDNIEVLMARATINQAIIKAE